MSDTTAIQVPPTPSVSIPKGSDANVRVPAAVISDTQRALPPQTDATQRVRAEVVAKADTGAVRVKLDGGEIEVRPAPPPQTQSAGSQNAQQNTAQNTTARDVTPQQTENPRASAERADISRDAPRSNAAPANVQISAAAVGRQIEIEIPARQQAQTQQSANVRAEQVILRLEAALVQTVQTQQAQTTNRVSATPVQVTVTDTAQAAPQVSINAQTGLPAAGELVNLLPLSSAESAAIIAPQTLSVESATLATTLAKTEVSGRALVAALTRNVSSTALQSPIPAPNNASALPATTAPVTGGESAQLQIIPALISAIPAAFSTPQAGAAALPAGLASLNVVQTAPSPIVTTTLIPAIQTTALSAQISATLPPQISLIAPETAAPALTSLTGYDEARLNAPPQDAARVDRITARFEGITQAGQPAFSTGGAAQTLGSTASAPTSFFALDYALSDAARAALQTLPQGFRAEFSLTQPLVTNAAVQGGAPVQASLAVPLTLPAITSFLTPDIWPAANALHQNIAQVSAQAASAFAAMTPSPSNAAQFGPAVMFFVAAMRSGDIAGWMGGKTVDALQKAGKGQALSKFMSDSAGMSRLAAEPAANDWRAMSIPLMHGEQIERVALYYKREDEGGADGEGNKGGFHRFIFNLNPENMGKVQLDGLFRGALGESNKGRLDLAVRTDQQFSQAMKMEMRRKYVDALEMAGVQGELSFQNNAESWVTITRDKQGFGASA